MRVGELATLTDRLAQATSSYYERAPGCHICRTPSRPDYVFGNYLILDDPPGTEALSSWLERARAAFPAGSGVDTVALQWERADRVTGMAPESAQMEHVVLAAEDGKGAHGPSVGPELVTVASDRQWEHVVRFAARHTATDEGWTRWRYAQYRALGEQSLWLVALEDDAIVASGGVIHDEGFARFQEVVTAADRRRRGLATSLCAELLYRTRRPYRVAVAVADPATGADSVYRRLGLQPAGFQYTIIAPARAAEGYG